MKRSVRILIAGVLGSVATAVAVLPAAVTGLLALTLISSSVSAFSYGVSELIWCVFAVLALFYNWKAYAKNDRALARHSGIMYTIIWVFEAIDVAMDWHTLTDNGIIGIMAVAISVFPIILYLIAGALAVTDNS